MSAFNAAAVDRGTASISENAYELLEDQLLLQLVAVKQKRQIKNNEQAKPFEFALTNYGDEDDCDEYMIPSNNILLRGFF